MTIEHKVPPLPRGDQGARPPRRDGLAGARIPPVEVSGAALSEIGLAIAARRTLTAAVFLVEVI